MYAPATQSQTGSGTSTPIALDDFQTPFNVGLAATLTGSATFSIEYSMNDPMTTTAANATWFAAPNFSAITATTGGSLTIPSKMVRINVASGAGTVSLQVVQAGPV